MRVLSCFWLFFFLNMSLAQPTPFAESNSKKLPTKEEVKDKFFKKSPLNKRKIIDKLWEQVRPKPFQKKQSPLELSKKSAQKFQSDKKKILPKNPISKSKCTLELKIEETITVATLDIIERAMRTVEKKNCSSLLLLINTPGGVLHTTRKIVDRILNANFPVLCLIHPAGAHAGSAGAIIMQACHVNGGIDPSNIGAATPITGGGKDINKDLRKKMLNDATSWLDSLTELRKRNKKFGREIITEAKAVSSKEAYKTGAIDFVGKTKEEFLVFAEGREVLIKAGKSHIVQVGEVQPFHLGFRHQFISLITNPQITYLLFSGSLILIYFEITHPGLGAPGIIGTIGLIISFMGMHQLDFSWAGLILLFLSIALFLAEIFISGFGIFGALSIVTFALGSFLLFDPSKTGGVDIPTFLIISITGLFSLIMATITWLAWSTLKLKKSKASDDFINKNEWPVEIVKLNKDGMSGMVFIHGENWRFQSHVKVKIGDKVRVLSENQLILQVEPLKETNSKSSSFK